MPNSYFSISVTCDYYVRELYIIYVSIQIDCILQVSQVHNTQTCIRFKRNESCCGDLCEVKLLCNTQSSGFIQFFITIFQRLQLTELSQLAPERGCFENERSLNLHIFEVLPLKNLNRLLNNKTFSMMVFTKK